MLLCIAVYPHTIITAEIMFSISQGFVLFSSNIIGIETLSSSHLSPRFQCSSCDKTWQSARVVVLFRYRLRGERGTVIMRPFGQACRRCADEEFDLPGFSEEEVDKALLRLFSKIRKNCYGDEDESDGGSSAGSGKVWTKPHEASLCEACIMGICRQDDD